MRHLPITMTLLGLTLVAVSPSGCLNLNKSYPEKRSFVLDVGAPADSAAEPSSLVLKINKLRMSPLFAGRAMVYRTGDLQYDSDFYDEWFIAPGSLITQQFHEWLSKSGRFQFVLMGTNHLEPTHLLEGTVTELYGDYRSPGQPKAVFGIELHLLNGANERQVLMRRTYRQEVPLTDRTPDAVAAGLTQALRLVLVEFQRDLTTAPLSPITK